MPTEPVSHTSLTLLQRLRESDGRAWERLVHLYGPLIRFWASRKGVTGADADDVTQEVFQAVSGAFETFRRDRPGDSFRGWLYGITRNVLLRHGERMGRQPQARGGTEALQKMNAVSDPHEDESTPPAEMSALYRRGLELVKGEFEGRTWQMFWQHVVEGRTPTDVAADLNVTAAAVRQAKSRILRCLREELGDIID